MKVIMFKINKLFMAFAILVCSIGATAQTYSGGEGTEQAPYLISSKTDMETLATAVNANDNYSIGKYFLLTQDITEEVTTIIGDSYSTKFRGTFDGGGHKINININNISTAIEDAYAGVFGCIEGAAIKNLGVMGSITMTSSYIAAWVGGICGRIDVNYPTIINNCYNTANISASSLSLNWGAWAGGICGDAWAATITNCYNTGNISAISESTEGYIVYAGGICGRVADNTSIANSYNTGNISASSSASPLTYSGAYAGGICGHTIRSITNCYNTGDISASAPLNNAYVGGICGDNMSDTIRNCYNTGNISISASLSHNAYAGGICGGKFYTTISNCFATNATITANANDYSIHNQVGRITGGRVYGDIIQNCYALATMQINGEIQSGQGDLNTGAGLNIEIDTLQMRVFYTTLDNWYNDAWSIDSITAVWDICESETLPWLRWQEIDCFVPVDSITNVPTSTIAGTSLTFAEAVYPSDATNQTIIWSISSNDDGSTNASISNNTLHTTTAGTATITATIINGAAVDSNYTQDFTIMVSEVAGISEVTEINKIRIYPNPANTMLYIELENSANGTLTLFDLNGKVVFSQAINGDSVQVNMSSLTAGNYILRLVENSTASVEVQVIKN
jgi:hypothetical protein